MYIKGIELKNFRNYSDQKIDFDEKVNIILGNNAQGKTNIIEAIYMSSMGRSFRTSRDAELIGFGGEYANIKVDAVRDEIDTRIEITLRSKGKNSSSKFVKKDKKEVRRTSELINNILLVVFSPEDLRIVKEEPEKRRRFIDREACQISPAYFDVLSNYKRTLIQRNAYLKENYVDPEILDIWDDKLAEYGSNLTDLRRGFIEKIGDYSARIHSGITGGGEELEIRYEPDIEPGEEIKEPEEKKKYFYERIKKAYESDMRNRTTTAGPHRDDIAFIVNGIDMRNFGSQGQQRTCALSLKLAELDLIREENGEEGILLLDDVMSELDSSRQEYLIDTMKNNQLFITTTDLDDTIKKKFSDAAYYRVEGGHIERTDV